MTKADLGTHTLSGRVD